MAVLVDAATFKSYMNFDAADTTQDELIETILAWSDAQVRNICGQEIALTTTDAFAFTAGRGDKLYLWNHPVRSIVSLKYRSNTTTTTWDKTLTAISATSGGDYEFLPRENAVRMVGGWSDTPYAYQISYTYGYQTIPADVQSVALEMAAIAWKESNASGKDGARLGVGSVSTSVSGISTNKAILDMMPVWDRSLSSYKYLGNF